MTKYHAIKTTVDGIKFDSKAEARRWAELVHLQNNEKIAALERQVAFELAPGVKLHGEKRKRPPIRYVADFTYFEYATNSEVIEDTKGQDTPMSRLKRHLMKVVHGMDVRVTR
jgi:hypothetical protein